MLLQWDTDPPREYRAKPGPGWEILVSPGDATGSEWDWQVTFKPDGGLGMRVSMCGPAKDAKEGMLAAEEAIECIGLAVREFKYHAARRDPDAPPPY